MAAHPIHEPKCPRCGYDQRGLCASWTESCPLEAICTECGLVYRSAEVLMPKKFEPKWCVEHCPSGIWSFIRACIGTFLRSLLPWRFWARLKMADRMQPRRLAVYVAILLLMTFLLPRVASPVSRQWNMAVRVWNDVHQDIAVQIEQNRRRIAMAEEGAARSRGALRAYSEEEQERLLAELKTEMQAYIARIQFEIDNPPQVEHSLLLAVLEAIFLPFAKESFGVIRHADGTTTPYPPPIDVWSAPWSSAPLWSNAPDLFKGGTRTSQTIILGVLTYLAFPLTLALLPTSRRRSKVRWAHIWRATAYGSVLPLLVILLASVLLFLHRTDSGGVLTFWLHMFSAVSLIPLGVAVWWTFAIGHYMKMPHALWIAALHTLLAVCSVLAFAWFFWIELLFPD